MIIDTLLSLVDKHTEWRTKLCLNLIPSENMMSPQVRELLATDLGNRYTAPDKFYMGTNYIDQIIEYGEKLAREIFHAEIADLRPLSGHTADIIIIANTTMRNDTMLTTHPKNGGYPGNWKPGLSELFGLDRVEFPFSEENWNIEIEEAKQIIRKCKPKLIIFGASFMLFPAPIRELMTTAREANKNVFVGYDGSHVLGLIAGNEFQQPLVEGADALFGSTHKSFFGPQGGIILTKKKYEAQIKDKIFPAFVDNAHYNRIAALTMALAEMQRYGANYAKQVVRNSKTLAKALHDFGFSIVAERHGFTDSHQVILDFGSPDKNKRVTQRLENANIIADSAIRFGTCEVTRRGMKEAEMHKIAELVKRTIKENEQPENIKKEIEKMISNFSTLEFCWDQ